MYIYINKEEQTLITTSKRPIPYDKTGVEEYEQPFSIPQPKNGYTFEIVWDAESKRLKVIETKIEVEEIIEQPTMEEQILFETKYQTLLLETMTLGGNI